MNKILGFIIIMVASSVVNAAAGGAKGALNTKQMEQLNKPKQECVNSNKNCACHKKMYHKTK